MKGVFGMMGFLNVREWLRWIFLLLMTVRAYRFGVFIIIIEYIFSDFLSILGYTVQDGATRYIR